MHALFFAKFKGQKGNEFIDRLNNLKFAELVDGAFYDDLLMVSEKVLEFTKTDKARLRDPGTRAQYNWDDGVEGICA